MAIIDLVRWQPQGLNNIFAWRFPHDNLSTYTQLLVSESQEAYLFSKGQILGKFGPGKHTLNTENLPILRNMFGIMYGGKNPFTAEVWYINKGFSANIPWRMTNMHIHDADYQTNIPIVASGQYGLRIAEGEKFLIKLVGTRHQYDQDDMTEQFNGEINSKVKSAMLNFMLTNRIGLKSVSAFLDQMSQYLADQMRQFWSEYGVDLTSFYISSVDIDTSTPEGRKISEAIATQSAMSITGHSWQQEQMFNTANQAINQISQMANGVNGGSGLLGGILAINMMRSMGSGMMGTNNGGGVGSDMMATQFNQPTFGGGNVGGAQQQGFGGNRQGKGASQNAQPMVTCAGCSQKFSAENAYCPHCGKKFLPCPRCGCDNGVNARRCLACGVELAAPGAVSSCPKCGTPLTPGSRFCGNCGFSAAAGPVCPRCGKENKPGNKFCQGCGNSLK